MHRFYIKNIIPENWYLYTWYELEKPMYDAFKTTKNLLLFIMFLIIIVAAVNTSSSLVMLIIEKRSEIAILKSAGGSPNQISLAFITVGFIIGVLGAFTGVSLGLVISLNINEIISFTENILNMGIHLFRYIFSPIAVFKEIEIDLFNSAYYLEEIPVRIELPELAGIAVLTIFISVCAAYLPAKKAGSIRPLDILRKH